MGKDPGATACGAVAALMILGSLTAIPLWMGVPIVILVLFEVTSDP
jgi:hypothetical protein